MALEWAWAAAAAAADCHSLYIWHTHIEEACWAVPQLSWSRALLLDVPFEPQTTHANYKDTLKLFYHKTKKTYSTIRQHPYIDTEVGGAGLAFAKQQLLLYLHIARSLNSLDIVKILEASVPRKAPIWPTGQLANKVPDAGEQVRRDLR